jgi:predicted kinase
MALIWMHAGRVLRAGSDVIIEGGFWSRASRDAARQRAKEFSVIHKFYALHCAADEARRRVLARTAVMQPGTLEITGPTFDLLLRQLEPLGTDEEYVIVETSRQNSSS